MRYTEKKHVRFGEKNGNIIESTVGAILTAPFILVKEIGMKLPFLKRKTIEQILAISILVAVTEVLIDSGIRIAKGTFDLYAGAMPLIVRLVGIGILLLIYVVYEIYDFAIYKNVEMLLPVGKGASKESAKKNSTEEKAQSVKKSSTESGAAAKEHPAEFDSSLFDYGDDGFSFEDMDLAKEEFSPESPQDESDQTSGNLCSEVPELDNVSVGFEDLGDYDSSFMSDADKSILSVLNDAQGSDNTTDATGADKADEEKYVIADNNLADYKEATALKVQELIEVGPEYTGDLTEAEIAEIEQNLSTADDLLDEALSTLLNNSETKDTFDEFDDMTEWGIPSYFNMVV